MSKAVHVVLQIEHTEDTVSGRVAVEGAPAAEFYGWLELISALERATLAVHRPDASAEASA